MAIGISEFRSTCRSSTRRSLASFALAVRTWSSVRLSRTDDRMYRENSAIRVSVAIGRIIALNWLKIAPTFSPCGPSAGRTGNLLAKIRISRNAGIA